MKIAVLTDIHANLPALRAALGVLDEEGYDLIVHLGDAIAIGPFPSECLDILLSLCNAHFIMGNHDDWFAHGLPTPVPQWMSEGEVEHQRWTHEQLRPELKSVVARWPYHWHREFNGVPAAFFHYALDASGRNFARIMRNPAATELDDAFAQFAPVSADLVFYGHSHQYSDIQGRARYVNPGSLPI
jgi:predicted phosphodiesterase